MMKIQTKFFYALALAVSLCANSASAGTIAGAVVDPASPGLGTATFPLVLTLSPNNDNSSDTNSGNNIHIITKAFEFNDYIDIVFTVLPSSWTTEYRVSETVDNDTQLDWIGYEMRLGFGTGAGFTMSAAGDDLDFDTADFVPNFDPGPSSTAFNLVGWGQDLLVFADGLHSTVQQNYEFHIDVPDFDGGQPYTFTLRQSPIAIPEPASVTLMALVIASLITWCRPR